MTGCGWGVLYQTDRLHGDGSSAECACERITPAGGHLPPCPRRHASGAKKVEEARASLRAGVGGRARKKTGTLWRARRIYRPDFRSTKCIGCLRPTAEFSSEVLVAERNLERKGKRFIELAPRNAARIEFCFSLSGSSDRWSRTDPPSIISVIPFLISILRLGNYSQSCRERLQNQRIPSLGMNCRYALLSCSSSMW